LRRRRFGALALAGALSAPVLAACSSSSSSGTPTLNWYIGHQAGGWIENAASVCNKSSGGKYTIKVQDLPATASDQREQLVRRLAAKDSSIDLIGMDVIWTAEFANAGWIKAFPDSMRGALTDGVLQGPVATVQYQNKIYAAPFTSNTQLLWYRSDLVAAPGKDFTWKQMTDQAAAKKLKVQMTGIKAESLSVTFNSVLASAGGHFLTDPSKGQNAAVSLEPGPTTQALTVLHDIATSPAADPSLSNNDEDATRQAFEKGGSAYELNYPFIYPSAKENQGAAFQNKIKWARYPEVIAGQKSRPPLGGFNIGVGAYTQHADAAYQAAQCIVGKDNQRFAAINGGNPPTRSDLYDDQDLVKVYPFAKVLRESINDAEPRPVSPAYNDLSLAVQDTLHPMSSISPQSTAKTLRSLVQQALKSEAVL